MIDRYFLRTKELLKNVREATLCAAVCLLVVIEDYPEIPPYVNLNILRSIGQ